MFVPLLSEDFIKRIKEIPENWEVDEISSNQFKNFYIKEIKRFLGSYHLTTHQISNRTETFTYISPTSFDSREKWPFCIHPIREQGKCGNC